MLKIRYTSQFKKDFKRIKKRGYAISKLVEVIRMLEEERKLPEKYHDHALQGNYERI